MVEQSARPASPEDEPAELGGDSPPLGEAPASRPERHRSFWRELPVLIVVAFAIALLIKTFLLQAFFIPSASMEPTLMVGDRVLVEKLSYRVGGPERGDVVVFEKDLALLGQPGPEADQPFYEDIADAFRSLFGFPTGNSQDFIKRVVGIGGDSIQGRDGKVFLNDEQIAEPYLPGGMTTSDFGPVEIPSGSVFVMGDNRTNSDDSRSFGPIAEDKIVGHAFVLIWPPADLGTL